MSKHDKPALHPKMQEFFDAHREHSEKKQRDVHDALVPIAEIVRDVRAHVLMLQHALHQAELESHDGRLNGKFNWMHSRIKGLDAKVTAWGEAGRDVAMTLAEVSAGFNQDVIDMSAMMADLLQPDETLASQDPPVASIEALLVNGEGVSHG